MDERRELRSVSPSPVLVALAGAERGSGASGSEGVAL